MLKLNNFNVFKTGYWLICNARDGNQKIFQGKLSFKTTLLSYNLKTDYIEDTLIQLKKCLEMEQPPNPGKYCDNCRWRNETKKF